MPFCKIAGCNKPSYSLGMCQMHYTRWHRYGRLERIRVVTNGICKIEGCTKKPAGRGYCSKHYYNLITFGNPTETDKTFKMRNIEKKYKIDIRELLIKLHHADKLPLYKIAKDFNVDIGTICDWFKQFKISIENRGKIVAGERWKDVEMAKKMIAGLQIKPNKAEKFLEHILNNSFPDEWKYVGDGQVIISGLCPDFINVNGKKKIIELFGKYWHDGNVRYHGTEVGRREVFREFGFDMLVIWDYELKDEQNVIEKIRGFL